MKSHSHKAAEDKDQASTGLRPEGRISAPRADHADVLSLQAAGGNRAVNQLLQGTQSYVARVIESPGNPLDEQTRSDFESTLGQDLSEVRVHTDPRAARTARFMGAAAYTAGNHVVFGSGKYAPTTPSGRELLAHELAHVSQMGGRMPSSFDPVSDHWEGEADQATRFLDAGGPATLSSAPPAVRLKLDPNLTSYLQKLRVLAKEPGTSSQRMEQVADRIEAELKGLDIQDSENYAIVVEELSRLFPDTVVTEFLLRYVSTHAIPSEPGRESRALEQTEKRMQVRPYKSGPHTPGTFFPMLFAEAFGSAVPSIPVPNALVKAVSTGGVFVTGVYNGMSEAIAPGELDALVDKLNKAGLLTIVFPPIFLAGAVFGIAEDAVHVIKKTVGLFQGDLGMAVAAAMEVLNVLMSPAGEQFAYQIGKELGRGFAAQLHAALNQNLVHFTFSLGKLIGPTIIYIVLTMAGLPQALMARAFMQIAPWLTRLLKNEARLLALIEKIKQSLPPVPNKKQLPTKTGDRLDLPENKAPVLETPAKPPAPGSTPEVVKKVAAPPAKAPDVGAQVVEKKPKAAKKKADKYAPKKAAPPKQVAAPDVAEKKPKAAKTKPKPKPKAKGKMKPLTAAEKRKAELYRQAEAVKKSDPKRFAELMKEIRDQESDEFQKAFSTLKSKDVEAGEFAAAKSKFGEGPEGEALKPKKSTGGQEPRGATIGRFAHWSPEYIKEMIKDRMRKGFPEDAAMLKKAMGDWPEGLEVNKKRFIDKEGTFIPDALDWEKRVVRELKPNKDTWWAGKAGVQTERYVEGLNKVAPGPKPWTAGPPIYYDADLMEKLLTKWGVIEPLSGK